MIKKLITGMALATTALVAAPASATLNVPVPANAFITIGNLDWAWAAPCPASGGCGDITLAYQGTQGWRLPTAEEFANHPTAAQFLFPGANVPKGQRDPVSGAYAFGAPDGDLACASAYFSTLHVHCDYNDGISGFWYGSGISDSASYGDTLVVRFNTATGAVPEPASWAMMITGFGLAGAALRRRTARHNRLLATA